jgi:hypothetical protein
MLTGDDRTEEDVMSGAQECTTTLSARARAASQLVMRVYPGAVGELLARELLAWSEIGHRLGGDPLVRRLVDHLEGQTDEPGPRAA